MRIIHSFCFISKINISKNKIYYNKTKGAISASKELRYHPNGEYYIEILLPKSNFNLSIS